MKFCVIADGSESLGMGHIIRTLSLAKSLRDDGHAVSYISSEVAGLKIVQAEGIDAVNEKDIITAVRIEKPDVSIIDRYDVSAGFFQDIRVYCSKIAYIDDLNAFDYPVDILINGTASASQEEYCGQTHASILLLGLSYNLVDKRFCLGKKREYRQSPQNILLTMGGTDPAHATQKLLELLQQTSLWAAFTFHVVIGKNCFYQDELVKRYNSNKYIRLHTNLDDLLPLMLECDFAISAGGITLYELIGSGTPSISVVSADNQLMQTEALSNNDLLPTFGLITEITVDHLNTIMRKIMADYGAYITRAQKACTIIDGNGARRIADILAKGS